MDGVPVVGAPAPLAAQVGPDAPGAEHHGTLQLVLIFLGLRDRPPSPVLVRDRPDELAVAVPAALADVDLPAEPQGVWRSDLFSHSSRCAGPPAAAVGGREAVGISPCQVFELIAQVAVFSTSCSTVCSGRWRYIRIGTTAFDRNARAKKPSPAMKKTPVFVSSMEDDSSNEVRHCETAGPRRSRDGELFPLSAPRAGVDPGRGDVERRTRRSPGTSSARPPAARPRTGSRSRSNRPRASARTTTAPGRPPA